MLTEYDPFGVIVIALFTDFSLGIVQVNQIFVQFFVIFMFSQSMTMTSQLEIVAFITIELQAIFTVRVLTEVAEAKERVSQSFASAVPSLFMLNEYGAVKLAKVSFGVTSSI
jgi:hypothetical protein